VRAEDRVLVLGASGGVGSTIVSLVHGLGARVWGHSGNPSGAAWLTGRGAERVVSAGPDELAEQVRELRPTVVFDPLGDGFTGAAVQALAQNGRLVTFGTSAGPTGTIQLQTIYRSSLRIMGYGGLGDSDATLERALAAALRAAAAGRFELLVGSELPLTRINDAYDLLAGRKVDGKIVLDLRE
jgi:NADPH2:quinone reductase